MAAINRVVIAISCIFWVLTFFNLSATESKRWTPIKMVYLLTFWTCIVFAWCEKVIFEFDGFLLKFCLTGKTFLIYFKTLWWLEEPREKFFSLVSGVLGLLNMIVIIQINIITLNTFLKITSINKLYFLFFMSERGNKLYSIKFIIIRGNERRPKKAALQIQRYMQAFRSW